MSLSEEEDICERCISLDVQVTHLIELLDEKTTQLAQLRQEMQRQAAYNEEVLKAKQGVLDLQSMVMQPMREQLESKDKVMKMQTNTINRLKEQVIFNQKMCDAQQTFNEEQATEIQALKEQRDKDQEALKIDPFITDKLITENLEMKHRLVMTMKVQPSITKLQEENRLLQRQLDSFINGKKDLEEKFAEQMEKKEHHLKRCGLKNRELREEIASLEKRVLKM